MGCVWEGGGGWPNDDEHAHDASSFPGMVKSEAST